MTGTKENSPPFSSKHIILMADKKQTAGNFLSLYKDSAFPDTRPPSQGLFPTTRDFLQPLERMEKSAACGQRGVAAAARGGAPAAGRHGPVEQLPPGSFGTHGADHVRPAAAAKAEWPTCAPPECAERRAEPRRPAFSLWEEEPAAAWAAQGRGVAEQGAHHEQLPRRWPPQPLFPAAPGSTNGSLLRSSTPAGEQTAKDGGSPMVATAVSGMDGFADDCDEGEEEKPHLREITMKIADGSTDSRDTIVDKEQKPSTPRSKHSATEQRRRMKINDRFQMLRSLIPNGDQKRDKASFLLEVIEYIQCLQEKVQKYESSHPGQNPVDSKLIPWNACSAPGPSIVDHSGIIRQHHTSTRFMFPAESDILSSPTVMSNNQNVPEPDNQGALNSKTESIPVHMQFSIGHGSGFPQHHVKLITDSLSVGVPPQSQWLRSSAMDAGINTDALSEHEELTISKGAESLSSLYSKRLVSTLKQALQHSGVDDSQASISVHINVRRQSTSHISSLENHDGPASSNHTVHSSMGNGGDEPAASKRHKSVTSS